MMTTSTCERECDVLRDLVTFVQFKTREKHPSTFFKFYK